VNDGKWTVDALMPLKALSDYYLLSLTGSLYLFCALVPQSRHIVLFSPWSAQKVTLFFYSVQEALLRVKNGSYE
jgi:hypothetical protein